MVPLSIFSIFLIFKKIEMKVDSYVFWGAESIASGPAARRSRLRPQKTLFVAFLAISGPWRRDDLSECRDDTGNGFSAPKNIGIDPFAVKKSQKIFWVKNFDDGTPFDFFDFLDFQKNRDEGRFLRFLGR